MTCKHCGEYHDAEGDCLRDALPELPDREAEGGYLALPRRLLGRWPRRGPQGPLDVGPCYLAPALRQVGAVRHGEELGRRLIDVVLAISALLFLPVRRLHGTLASAVSLAELPAGAAAPLADSAQSWTHGDIAGAAAARFRLLRPEQHSGAIYALDDAAAEAMKTSEGRS